MSIRKGLLNGPPRSAFGEAAARLEQLERSLSGRPVAETRGAVRADEPRGHRPSPDEEWSRKFMNLGIGPRPELPQLRKFPAGFRLGLLRTEPVLRAAPVIASVNAVQDGPIGRAVGKYVEPKRFWLTRLFRRR